MSDVHAPERTTSRRLAVLPLAGAAVWVLVSPLHALSYFATDDGRESLEAATVRLWAEPARDLLEPLLTWASPDTVYTTYGKALGLAVLGVLGGLLALRSARDGEGTRGESRAFRVALAGYTLLSVGVVVEYWTPLLEVGFFFFALPGILLSLAGSTMLGVTLLRAGATSRPAGWLLALALPLLFATTALFGHLSVGLGPLVIAWAVIAVRLRRAPQGAPLAPEAQQLA